MPSYEAFLDKRLLATQQLALAIAALHCPEQPTVADGIVHIQAALEHTRNGLAMLRDLEAIAALFDENEGAPQQ